MHYLLLYITLLVFVDKRSSGHNKALGHGAWFPCHICINCRQDVLTFRRLTSTIVDVTHR